MHKSLRAVHAHIKKLGNHHHVKKVTHHFHKHSKKYLALNIVASLLFVALSLVGAPQNKTFAAGVGDLTFFGSDPNDNATGVTASSNIMLAFSDSNTSNVADFSTIATNISGSTGDLYTSNVRILPAGGTYPDDVVTGTVTHYSADIGGVREIYEVNPSSNLAEGTIYTVTLIGGGGGITADTGADWMTSSDSFSFTTYSTPPADNTPPTISSVTPSNGTVYVTGATISVTFDEAMNTATFGNMTVTNLSTGLTVDGSWGGSVGNTVATFGLSGSLVQYTEYQISMPTSLTDAAGNPLSSLETSNFLKLNGSAGSYPGATAPTVNNGTADPAPMESNASVSQNISVQLNQALDPDSISSNVQISTLSTFSGAVGIVATLDPNDGRIIIINPGVDIEPNTKYYVLIKGDDGAGGGVKNVSGTPLALPYTWSFSTGTYPSDTTSLVLDTNNPSFYPAYDGSDNSVAVGDNITIPLTETNLLKNGVLTDSTVYLKAFGSETHISGAISYDVTTKTITFNPTSDLTAGTNYTMWAINLDDEASNGGYVNSWNFMTASGGGGGGVPEFSTYMYILTLCAGAWMIQKKYGFEF